MRIDMQAHCPVIFDTNTRVRVMKLRATYSAQSWRDLLVKANG
jgi:hypothetical protein